MNAEEKQALIEHIESDLELWRNVTLKYCHEVERADVLLDIKVNEIALASLTTQPVKLPDLRQSVSGERYVWSDAVYNYRDDVIKAINDAGYHVTD